jgi:hypothetical protein
VPQLTPPGVSLLRCCRVYKPLLPGVRPLPRPPESSPLDYNGRADEAAPATGWRDRELDASG